MNAHWHHLEVEMAYWRRAGLTLPLWWRDDDAAAVTPALGRLLKLGEDLSLPVHLAVIPQRATTDLGTYCSDSAYVVPLVHGWAHKNHAPEGQKKAEFGHPHMGYLTETKTAFDRMTELFGENLLPMFVPPWNRIHSDVVTGLQSQGFTALSTYNPRPARLKAGLVQINTHIDPILWKAGRGLADEATTIKGVIRLLQDRRFGFVDAAEPLGLLTHHLVHDEAIWDFTKHFLSVLLEGGATPINLLKMKDILP